jgi:hypothetical protein
MCIKMRRATLVVILAAASLLATFHVEPAGAASGRLRLIASGPARQRTGGSARQHRDSRDARS